MTRLLTLFLLATAAALASASDAEANAL